MTTVIIGGGLAGLAAAYMLAGKDEIIIFEKNLNSAAWHQATDRWLSYRKILSPYFSER